MSDPAGADEQRSSDDQGDQGGTDDSEGSEGSDDSDGSEDEVSDEDVTEIEEERQERLDPDNRPDNAEVDNTNRDFDAETGTFTDTEEHEEAEPKFVAEEDL